MIETISFFTTGFLAGRGVVYSPNLPVDVDLYLAERHPLLGWPSAVPNPKQLRDDCGARTSPLFPDRGKTPPALSVYGDSFSWSSGVQEAAAWTEVLSGLIGDRVDNFGVGGYGSDQALLRYQEHCRHGIETTLLMHLTENILRNVNQYRDLLYRGKACGFKPRFIVRADGRLQLVPLPDIGSEHFGHFAADPQKWLKHEVFLPDAAFGPVRRRFPYAEPVPDVFTLSYGGKFSRGAVAQIV